MTDVLKERTAFFQPNGQKTAPKDRQRREMLVEQLFDKGNLENGKLKIRVGSEQVCPAAWLRILGLLRGPDMHKAPNQCRRILQQRRNNYSKEQILAGRKTKLDCDQKFPKKRGCAEAHIQRVATNSSDTLP